VTCASQSRLAGFWPVNTTGQGPRSSADALLTTAVDNVGTAVDVMVAPTRHLPAAAVGHHRRPAVDPDPVDTSGSHAGEPHERTTFRLSGLA
jgi:hypothetical protein